MSIALDIGLLYDSSPVEDNSEGKHQSVREVTDEALVSRAKTGDYGAFEELVRRYRNDVFALSYHFVREREEAWDISQEVFIKAYRALGTFRGDASFKTWLLRITANRCKDYFKKRTVKTVSFDDTIRSHDAASGEPSPDKALEVRELGEAIQTALGSLPEKHRVAFVLREFEGLTYENMASVMGCNLGTVMSRLHHARRKLRKALIAMNVTEDN